MKNFDFEGKTPPVITENELKALARARNLRRQMIAVGIGTLLTLISMLILSAAAFCISPKLGAITLIAPIYTVLGGGSLVFVFVLRQKRIEHRISE